MMREKVANMQAGLHETPTAEYEQRIRDLEREKDKSKGRVDELEQEVAALKATNKTLKTNWRDARDAIARIRTST